MHVPSLLLVARRPARLLPEHLRNRFGLKQLQHEAFMNFMTIAAAFSSRLCRPLALLCPVFLAQACVTV